MHGKLIFAQSIEESGARFIGAIHGEGLNYSAEALPIQFKAFRKEMLKEEQLINMEIQQMIILKHFQMI